VDRVAVRYRPVPEPSPAPRREEALRAVQARVLELVATGAPLEGTLESLVRLIETHSPGMLGSVLLLDEAGRHLLHGAAPSLPAAYNAAIAGAEIGPSVGSCGTAAYRDQAVIVSDIEVDPLWASFRDLAASAGVRACWSTPIHGYSGQVLGTFAMYYREPRLPDPEDLRIIELATHLAGIAIERRRADVQRRRDQDALRESERSYRALYTQAPVMMHSVDRGGHILSVSDEWLGAFGYARGEVLGRSWLELLTPASRERAAAVTTAPCAGRWKDLPFEFVDKGGAVMDVLLSAIAERDAGGEIVRILAVLVDVSERKRAEDELARYREHLEELVGARTRTLESLNKELEAFASSVSHDLRAPLRSIDGFSKILLEDYGPVLDEKGREHLGRIRAASRRMAQLIDDLLDLARVSRGELRSTDVDLSAVAHAVVDALREGAPERAVNVTIEEGLVAHGDPVLLRVVLENLIGNAWKFTGKHLRAHIAFGRGETPHSYVVRDDGAGFDMAYVDKLFGAFQRLHGHEEFEGTGIGLATVQRIVQRHGGRVWAEGAVERGAAFWFTLDGPDAGQARERSSIR
jgi:PAS domain S-box-containing protein